MLSSNSHTRLNTNLFIVKTKYCPSSSSMKSEIGTTDVYLMRHWPRWRLVDYCFNGLNDILELKWISVLLKIPCTQGLVGSGQVNISKISWLQKKIQILNNLIRNADQEIWDGLAHQVNIRDSEVCVGIGYGHWGNYLSYFLKICSIFLKIYNKQQPFYGMDPS